MSKEEKTRDAISAAAKQVERLTTIRFPSGIVGKMSAVIFSAVIGTSILGWAAGGWMAGGLGALLIGYLFYATHGVLKFADKYPHAAAMEGTELLKHEQLKMMAKGLPEFPVLPASITADPDEPQLLPEESPQALLPDTSPPKQIEGA